MTTSMADPLDFGEHHQQLHRGQLRAAAAAAAAVASSPSPASSSTPYAPQLLEQRAFNSGQLGARTLPTQTVMGVCTPGSSSTHSDVVVDSAAGYSGAAAAAAAAGHQYNNHYANPYHAFHAGQLSAPQQASTSQHLQQQHQQQPAAHPLIPPPPIGGYMRVHSHPQGIPATASIAQPQHENNLQQQALEQQQQQQQQMAAAAAAAAAAGIGEPMNVHHQGDSSGEAVVFAAPSGGTNEYSNLSSAGSISDKEQPETPGRASNSRPAPDKKSVRKRRKGEDTPRAEKKITDFIRSSPKRSRVGSNASSYVNGDGGGGGGQMMGGGNGERIEENNHNHWCSSLHPHTAASPSRVTPTPHSSNDSNSSPPNSRDGFSLPTRVDDETQTDDIQDSRVDAATMHDEVSKRDRIIEDLRKQCEEHQRMSADWKQRLDTEKEIIRQLLVERNEVERKKQADKLTSDDQRIGSFRLVRHGSNITEAFVEGYAHDDLSSRLQKIADERDEIERSVKLLKKRKPPSKETKSSRSLTAQMNALASDGKGGPSSSDQPSSMASSLALLSSSSNPSTSTDDGFTRPELPLAPLTLREYQEQEEIYRLRKENLKKEEADIASDKEKLERETQLHKREYKRSTNERNSSHKHHPVLNSRYLLLSLLGKGGFSEVWKAYDLDENRYVACKIHHVNKEWKEEKKANYVKHAMREKDIHRTLNHDRIVKLHDLFTIDNHSFCTVLEYCGGNDLDCYLKQNKSISEKEARNIIMQVSSALMYLAERKPPIIHYDLKPANILLEHGTASGAIKITDFGLSKVMANSDDADSDIDLTSQFAGTYWYLPPETFVIGHSPPKISSKVDVWSVGVILYQCIYGKKPFGNEQTQQRILEEKTIIKATEVNFPMKPQISPSAQHFIRRCLQYKKEDRADVFELNAHEFFKFGPRSEKKLAPASPASRLGKVESMEE